MNKCSFRIQQITKLKLIKFLAIMIMIPIQVDWFRNDNKVWKGWLKPDGVLGIGNDDFVY